MRNFHIIFSASHLTLAHLIATNKFKFFLTTFLSKLLLSQLSSFVAMHFRFTWVNFILYFYPTFKLHGETFVQHLFVQLCVCSHCTCMQQHSLLVQQRR